MWRDMPIKRVIAIVKLSMFVTWCWPLPKDAIKFKVVCAQFYQYVCLFLTLALTLGLINTVRNHLDNPLIMAKSMILMCPTVHIICNIINCKANTTRLQSITFEMENFCELLQPHENAIVQQYIAKCVYFYGGSLIWLYFSITVIICGPISIPDQPLPTNAEYPFDIDRQPMRYIAYLHQAIIFVHVGGQLSMNVFMALLLWFTSVKFELLAEELRTSTNIYDVLKCIQKHQKLLTYTEEVIVVVRPFALVTVILSTTALIIVGLVFITGPPLSMKVECVSLIFSGLTEVFMYTWPAEHLIYISGEVGQAAFGSRWYEKSVPLRKNLQMIIFRTQKPVVISIPCVMPTLSLSYYTSVRKQV